MIRRSFTELSKSTFFPLYCAIVQPHLEYAMEAPTLRAGQGSPPWDTASGRSPSRAIWGTTSPSQLLLAGTQTPPSWSHPGPQDFQRGSWPNPIWFVPPTTPSRAKRENLQTTARIKPSSTKGRCISMSLVTSLVMSLSVSVFEKTIWPSIVRNHSCSTCVISVPVHRHFSPSLL